MSKTGIHGEVRGVLRGDDAVEALLEQASPRPAPPKKDERMIREAVLSEWEAVTGKRRVRAHLTRFAVAATVLLGVAVSFNMLQTNGVAPIQVASISKDHGSIYIGAHESQLTQLTDLSTVFAGQVIVTGDDAGMGLAWGKGGSLRIDENTRIEFISDVEIYLSSGRVYFDSTPSELIASISGGSTAAELRILTDQGAITHLGTQYMTYTKDGVLEISVREGEVMVDGNYHDARAMDGQQLTIAGSARPSVANFARHGEAWSWIEETSPLIDTDGRSVHAFLDWVGRETGLRVEYPDAATEQAAADIYLNGTVNLKPRAALDFWLQGQDLSWETDGGTIKVSAIDGSSGR